MFEWLFGHKEEKIVNSKDIKLPSPRTNNYKNNMEIIQRLQEKEDRKRK